MRDQDRVNTAPVRPADELLHGDEGEQQADADNHVRHDKRRRDQTGKERPPAKTPEPGERQSRHGAEQGCPGRIDHGDLQGQPGRVQDLLVPEQFQIPFRRPAAPDTDQLRGVEAEDDEHDKRQIKEGKPGHHHAKQCDFPAPRAHARSSRRASTT